MNTTKVQFAVPCATLSITVAPLRAHVCLPGQASIVLYEGSESGFLLIEEVNRTVFGRHTLRDPAGGTDPNTAERPLVSFNM